MGLFSDDLDYKDLDALCIKVKHKIGESIIELPLYVDARISYVTFSNAKEVKIEDSTVKELKKNGKLFWAIKPIFEKYLTDEANAHPDVKMIFQQDPSGKPQLDFYEKWAKEVIDSRLFKQALIKIDDPDGFDEVKFEKIYGIAPVGFKIRNISSGFSIPYDYSEAVNTKENTAQEGACAPELSFDEDKTAPISLQVEEVSETIEKDAPVIEEKAVASDEIARLQEEAQALEEKCAQRQLEIQAVQQTLENRLREYSSLDGELKKKEKLVTQQAADQKTLSKCLNEFKHRITNLESKRQELYAQLENLKTDEFDETTNLLYSIIKNTRGLSL